MIECSGDESDCPPMADAAMGAETSRASPPDLVPVNAVDDIEDERHRTFFEYWNGTRDGEALPSAGMIDPLKLPRGLLPFLIVIEVEPAPLRFKVRLTGTAINDETGMNTTGRYSDTLPNIEPVLARFTWCVRNRQPYLVTTNINWSSRDYKRYSVLTAPFGIDGQVTRLVQTVRFLTL